MNNDLSSNDNSPSNNYSFNNSNSSYGSSDDNMRSDYTSMNCGSYFVAMSYRDFNLQNCDSWFDDQFSDLKMVMN